MMGGLLSALAGATAMAGLVAALFFLKFWRKTSDGFFLEAHPKLKPVDAPTQGVYFAGCGIQGGRAIGKSDSIGAYPAENAIEPPQVVATIYKCLGFDFDTALPGPAGRPFPLVDFGKAEIRELF